MALANYMGPVGLIGVGQRDRVNLAGIDFTEKAPLKTKTKSPGTKNKKTDYEGYEGDAHYQSNLDMQFQNLLKGGMQQYGNDMSWYSTTDDYKDLVNQYQGNIVKNEHAAKQNYVNGERLANGFTAKDANTSPNQIVMKYNEEIQDFTPFVDGGMGVHSKGDLYRSMQVEPSIAPDGSLSTRYVDYQGGSEKQLRAEINSLYDKAAFDLEQGGKHIDQSSKTGSTKMGTNVAFTKTRDRKWSNKNNFKQLRAAANYMKDNFSREAQYALAQDFWQNAKEGQLYVPKGLIKDGSIVEDFTLTTNDEGNIDFEEVQLTEELANNKALLAKAQDMNVIRHVQDIEKIHQDQSNYYETWDAEESVLGDNLNADGSVRADLIGVGTGVEMGVTMPGEKKENTVYTVVSPEEMISELIVDNPNLSRVQLGGMDMDAVRALWASKGGGRLMAAGGYDIYRASPDGHADKERDVANTPFELPQISDHMRFRSPKDFLNKDRQIRIGGLTQKMSNKAIENLTIADTKAIGEYFTGNYITDENGNKVPEYKYGIRVLLTGNEDEVEESGLQYIKGDEGGKSNLIGGYWEDELEAGTLDQITGQNFNSPSELNIAKADGTPLTDEEYARLNKGDGTWENDSGVAFEAVMFVDNLSEWDKFSYTAGNKDKFQTQSANVGLQTNAENLGNFRNQALNSAAGVMQTTVAANKAGVINIGNFSTNATGP